MPEVQVQQQFASPRDRVWDLLTAFERYPERVGSYEAVEFSGEQREGIGARWRQTRTVFGRSHSQEIEITGWEPPLRLVLAAREAGALYETRYELASVDEHTEVTMTFSVAATNPVAWIFLTTIGRRFLRSTNVALMQDLSDLSSATVD